LTLVGTLPRLRFRSATRAAAVVAVVERLRDAWRVEFRILGPVEARAAGRALELDGSRQRALLAVLLSSRGSPVSRDRLVADLWGEAALKGAANALRAAVSRLRRALADDTLRLVTSPPGYRLPVGAGELDVERFEAACEGGGRALAAGLPERAVHQHAVRTLDPEFHLRTWPDIVRLAIVAQAPALRQGL
jgi:DNA-binding SARP family transcriptional activator